MKFLGIPTDNLYKFMALSGVVVAIANAYFFVSKVFEYKDELSSHSAELKFLASITEWGVAIGTAMAAVGFFCWYIKHQRPIDNLLKARSELAMLKVRMETGRINSPNKALQRTRKKLRTAEG